MDQNSGMNVRPAAEADLPAIRVLLEQLGYPSAEADLRDRLRPLFDAPDYRIFVAESDRVLGLISAQVLRSVAEPAPALFVTAMVVDEAARGQGVGRLLIDAVEAFARAEGCNRVLVTSGTRRAEAHAFYESRGFEKTGVRLVKKL